jgi:dephospho-CoA kinase
MAPGGKAYFAITAAFPFFEYPEVYTKKMKGPLGKNRYLDRKGLGALVFSDPYKRAELEGILHPLVRNAQNEFIVRMKRMGKEMVLLDIPLLFETNAHQFVDVTINVAAPYNVQRARVLARPNMTEDKFHAILNNQMPSAEKSRMADYIIPTGLNRAQTFAAVREVLRDIKTAQPLKYEKGETNRIY